MTRRLLASVAAALFLVLCVSGCSKSVSVGQEFVDGPLTMTVVGSQCAEISNYRSCIVRLVIANRSSTEALFSAEWQSGKLANGTPVRTASPSRRIIPVGAESISTLIDFAVNDSTLTSVTLRGSQESKGTTVTLTK